MRGPPPLRQRNSVEYDLFISYSSEDVHWATVLERSLEDYAKPWHRKRALTIFRDQSSMAAASGLWSELQAALDNSKNLLVLTSPAASRSLWVRREIDYWISTKSSPVERILLVNVTGDLIWDEDLGEFGSKATALPSPLRKAFDSEPLYIDLSDFRDDATERPITDLDLSISGFRNAIARIAAPIHGKSLLEMEGEAVEQHRRTRRHVIAAVVALLLLAVVALGFAIRSSLEASRAERERDSARANELAAQSIAVRSANPALALVLAAESLAIAPTPASGLVEAQWGAMLAFDEQVGQPYPARIVHEGGVRDIAYDPTGRLLATGGADRIVRVFDMLENREAFSFVGSSRVNLIEFGADRDGELLLAVGSDRGLRLWRVSDWQEVPGPLAELGAISAMSFGSANGTIVVATTEPGLYLVTQDSQANWRSLALNNGVQIRSLDFNTSGDRFAGADEEGSVRVWSTTAPFRSQQVVQLAEPLLAAVFSPGGETLATSSAHSGIQLWDSETWQSTAQISPDGAVWDLAFEPGGDRLVSVGAGASVQVWDLNTGNNLATLKGHTNLVRGVAYAPDGRTIASAGIDETMRLWDTSEPRLTRSLLGHRESVKSIAISPDGNRLASGGIEREWYLWDIATGTPQPVAGHVDSIWGVTFSPMGDLVATASADRTIRLWAADTGAPLGVLVGHDNSVWGVAFAPDGSELASGSVDETVRIWDLGSGEERLILSGHGDRVRSVAYSHDGRQLASASSDGTVRVWDTEVGREVHVLTGPLHAERTNRSESNEVWDVAFSPSGDLLATANKDMTVRIWNVADGQLTSTLSGHTDSVESVAFDTESGLLISGGLDRTVRVWNVDQGVQVAVLTYHAGSVDGVTTTPSAGFFASAGSDRDIRLTPFPDTESLCGFASNYLDLDELDGYLPGMSAASSCVEVD